MEVPDNTPDGNSSNNSESNINNGENNPTENNANIINDSDGNHLMNGEFNNSYASSNSDSNDFEDIQELPQSLTRTYNRQQQDADSEAEIVEIDTKPLRRISRFMTFINLTNSLLGAGIISMSSSFKAAGLGPTVLLLIISCILCYISGVVLLNLQCELHISNIDELANGIFGRPCHIITAMLIFIFDLAFTTAYLVIGTDSILSWLRCSPEKYRKKFNGFGAWAIIITIYSMAVIALTIPRNLIFLDKFQMLTVFLIVFYAIAILARGFAVENLPAPSVVGTKFSMSLFTSFSAQCLTFCLPIHMLPVISPYNPNQLKRQTIMASSLFFCFIVIAAPGAVGYLIFGNDAKSDLLRSFPDNDVLMIIVRVAIFLIVTFSYPVIIKEMVGTLGGFIYHNNNPAEMTLKQRCILIPIVNLISYVFALLSNTILPILGIGGALGTFLVTFAFPSICRLKITHSKLSHPRNIGHIIFACFGIAMAVICLYTSINDLVDAYKQQSIYHH